MRIYGVDFTSAPKRDKPIVVAACEVQARRLVLERFHVFTDWPAYELWLASQEGWIGGFDFPFGLPQRFVESRGWKQSWAEMVSSCVAMGKEQFADAAMKAFLAARSPEDKHRKTDFRAGSHSPLKTRTNPPVGLMFYEGAWRLLKAGIHVPGLHETGSGRVAVEAYPGLLVRRLNERYYKNDSETSAMANSAARRRLLAALKTGEGAGLMCALVCDSRKLDEQIADKSGDWLDAVMCAVQAHAAWLNRDSNYGLPEEIDPVEGWIVGA